jgi:hypothetical protein
MDIEVKPLGKEYRFDGKESAIVELFDTASGLRIIVSTWVDSINETFLQVYFRHACAYRYLDEGDLSAWWKTERFQTPYHVYEITKGGWLNGEALEPGILDVSKGLGFREWFICTTNECMNVLANSEPELKDLKS